LKKFLAGREGNTETFSAASLAQEFELKPHEQPRTTITRIHQALRSAWESGEIVAFFNADGAELCEREHCVQGGAHLQHPQIYGLPGAVSPQDGYEPTSYQQFLALKNEANGFHRNGNGTAASAAGADAQPAAEDDTAADAPEEPADAPEVDEEVKALAQAAMDYDAPGPAPEWLPDRVLTHIVTLPMVLTLFREGLDRAKGAEKVHLISTGIRRKGQVDPLTATKLVALCRAQQKWWDRVIKAATSHYLAEDEWIDDDDLPALRQAPDEFFLDQPERYHPEAVVLCGIELGASTEALTWVAEEAASQLDEEQDQQTVNVQDQLRRQVSTQEALAAELNKQLEERTADADTHKRHAEQLTEELQRLQAHGAASEADVQQQNQDLRSENASLQTRLEAAAERSAVVDELRAQVAHYERGHDELSVRAAAGENERKLREQVEARLQEQVAETRRLERDLQETDALRVPLDSVQALARALAKPIGEATEHAARRLAAGHQQPDDAKLLQFAGAFSELASAISPTAPSPAARPPAPAPPAQPSAQPAAEVELSAAPAPTAEPAAPPEPAPPAEQAEPPASDDAGPSTPARRRSRRTAAFTVHPFGGAGEVGGSAIVVQTRSGHTVLLDAGQRVKGEYGLDSQSPFHYSLPSFDQLDAIVISHAHIDHIGSLPLLYREYQRHRDEPLPVLMSDPTRRVGEIMMRDSAKIQHKREYLTGGAMADLAQSDFAPELDIKPAYTDADINAALEAVQVLDARQPRLIPGTNVTVKLLPVAHVLGSCAVYLTDNDTGATLLYTGDLGPLTETQRTLPDFDGVNGFDHADIVIMESTYALASDSEREGRRGITREDSLNAFYRAARKAAEAGGHVLLPAFALGRTQELLRVIEDAVATEDLPPGDVYIGGMGEKITDIYSDHKGSMWVAPGEMRRASEMNRWLKDGTTFDEAVEEAVSRDSFSYIICSPAMLSGGWSRAFLRRMVDEERHAIVFTGYLPRHGGGIRNLGHLHQGGPITLDDHTLKIKCEWQKASLSAHAPRQDLLGFAQRMLLGDKQVRFGVLHGTPDAQASLAADINESDGAAAESLSNGVPWKPQLG
jgi:Cft2 family RNA processing exonuclease